MLTNRGSVARILLRRSWQRASSVVLRAFNGQTRLGKTAVAGLIRKMSGAGAKARIFVVSKLIGPTEVVPLLQSFADWSFSATCDAQVLL